MGVFSALNVLTELYCTRWLKINGLPNKIANNPAQSSIKDYRHHVANTWTLIDFKEIINNYDTNNMPLFKRDLNQLYTDYPAWLLDPGFYITINDIKNITKLYNTNLSDFKKYAINSINDYNADYDEQIFDELFNQNEANVAKNMLNNWVHEYD